MRATICDVGPRDGLQNEQAVLPSGVRAELVNRLAAAGLPAIEAAGFVHPRKVPQMAAAEEVVAALERRDGVAYPGLVLDEKGYERFSMTEPTRSIATSPRPTPSVGETRTRRPWRRSPSSGRSRRRGP